MTPVGDMPNVTGKIVSVWLWAQAQPGRCLKGLILCRKCSFKTSTLVLFSAFLKEINYLAWSDANPNETG